MKQFITVSLVTVTAALALSGCAVEDTSTTGGSASADATSGGDKPAVKKSSKPKPSYTVAQQSAIRAAKEYLSLGSGFSRAGLIEQLSSSAGSGFKRATAVFAVNHMKIDYNKQAVIAAKGYMDMSGFSRKSLIEQLSSKAGSQFTVAQATFAANKIGL